MLEQIIEQELEGFCVFESFSMDANPCANFGATFSPTFMDNLTTYMNHLEKEMGISSASVKPNTSSNPPKPEDITTEKLAEMAVNIENKSYQCSSISQSCLDYIKNLGQQLNIPSTLLPITPSAPPSLDNFWTSIAETIQSINNICPSTSLPLPYIPSVAPEPDLNFPPPKIEVSLTYTRPKKEPLDHLNSFKKDFEVNFSGLNEHSGSVLNVFKNNDLPNIYTLVKEGMHMNKTAINSFRFIKPLKIEEESPFFKPVEKEITLPIIKPKSIPFEKTTQQKYRDMLLNSFLPHEMAHANICDKYPNINYESPGIIGFNEHLADAMAHDSVKHTFQEFKTKDAEIKFQNLCAIPQGNKPSFSQSEYDANFNFKDASRIIGKQATINMLNDTSLKQTYDSTLKNTLELNYGNDYKHKTFINKEINNMTNFYQDKAQKIVGLSKISTTSSYEKADSIWQNVNKKTFNFLDKLK